MHNMGKAIDWDYFPGARDWIHKNAEKHGLRFRMNWEDWHIEPVEGRGALSPQIPDDADAAVRLNTMPGVPNARFDGQIELNIREQDQRGKTIRQQAHVLKAEPKIAGTPGKSQRWTVPYGIHGSW
jgi:hypothetical protein